MQYLGKCIIQKLTLIFHRTMLQWVWDVLGFFNRQLIANLLLSTLVKELYNQSAFDAVKKKKLAGLLFGPHITTLNEHKINIMLRLTYTLSCCNFFIEWQYAFHTLWSLCCCWNIIHPLYLQMPASGTSELEDYGTYSISLGHCNIITYCIIGQDRDVLSSVPFSGKNFIKGFQLAV